MGLVARQRVCKLGGAGSQEVSGWSELISPGQYKLRIGYVGGWFNTGKMALACRLHRRRARQRDNGDCPSSPLPEVTQLSLSPYVSCAFQAADLLLEPRVSVCEQLNLCAGPLRRHLDLQIPSVSPRQSESPLIFIVKFCENSSSWHWKPRLGSPNVELGPITSLGGPLQPRCPS